MPITSTTNKVVYNGNASTTEFAFSYPIRSTSEIGGVIYNETTGAETALVVGTNCTATIATDYTSATVTVSASAGSAPYGVLSATEQLVLNRVVPYTNNLDFRNHDGLLAEVVDEAIDRLKMNDQRLQEQIDRSLKIQISEDSTNPDITIDTELPTLKGVGTAGKYMKITSDGDATPVYTLTWDAGTFPNGVYNNSATSTDNAVARFSGTTGFEIQNSGVIIDDSNNMTGLTSINIGATIAITGVLDEDNMASDSAVKLATQQSIKAYVDTKGDASGPASSTDNAIARFDGTTGKLIQNSGCTIDDSDNTTIGGTLTVNGDHIYTGDATILDNVWGPDREAHLQVAASTSGHGRIVIQGGSATSYAPAGLIIIDSQSTTNKRAWSLTAGMPSTRDIFALSLSNDDGTNVRTYFKVDVSGTATTTINSNTVISGSADIDGTTTVSGQLRIDSAAGSFWSPAGTDSGNADNFVIGPNVLAPNENGMTIIGTITNKANIFFGDSVDSTLGRVVYDNSVNSLALWSNGALALTLDSSQNATLATGNLTVTAGNITATAGNITCGGDITVGAGDDATQIYINGTAGTNSDVEFQAAGTPSWRLRDSNAGKFQILSGTSVSTLEITDTTGHITIPTGNLTVTTGDLIITTTGSPLSGDSGTTGTIAWDANYLYVCTASGAWKRVALTGGY